MQSSALKDLTLTLRRISADLKRCRAGHDVLCGLAAFNGTGDALPLIIHDLQAAAEALAKNTRQYAKAVSDLASNITSVASGVHLSEQE